VHERIRVRFLPPSKAGSILVVAAVKPTTHCRYASSVTSSIRTGRCCRASVSPRGLTPAIAPSSATGRARDGGGQISAALTSSTTTDGRRAIIVAAVMAAYLRAVTISLPNAALHRGTLSMADEVGWIFTSHITANVTTMTIVRWLADLYGRRPFFSSGAPSLLLALCSRRVCRPSPRGRAANPIRLAAALWGPVVS
jgi:hypothetical protein